MYLPSTVDSSESFGWYKQNTNDDITFTYFRHYDLIQNEVPITYIEQRDRQYDGYKDLEYTIITPYIEKYFSPTDTVVRLVETIQSDYTIDYANTCVLFHRGNDKVTEVDICTYDDMIEKANEVQALHPGIRFLIQSDETEFIDEMTRVFPNSVWFDKDIRHMNRKLGSLDLLNRDNIHLYSLKFLAITIIMSKCKYVVCGTGNCSLWIAYYRGNSEGMYQYREDRWV
jgi:hypothetical protein